MAPAQRLATAITSRTADLWRGYVRLVAVEHENQRLRGRMQDLERRATAHRETEFMNHRLKRLLALQRRLPSEAAAAEVAGRDPTVWFQSLTLDKGELDGIKTGMPVLATDGVVGVISSTSPRAARVLLLSDPNSGIDVLVQRTRVRGIVSGQLDRGAILKYVKRTEDVQVGDRLVTSGLDGIFPKGISVGRIARLSRKDRGLFLYAEVTPSADIPRLEEVLVAAPSGAELLPIVPLPPRSEVVGPPAPPGLEMVGPPLPPPGAPGRPR
jgi:rod shape-determining protein MreC